MIKATASGGTWPGTWSVGNRKYGIAVGDRALLIRQHRDRGIVASGRFTSEIYEDVHWSGEPDQTARYADVDFDTWLPAEDALSIDGLKRDVPEVTWDRLQAGGVPLSEAVANRLETSGAITGVPSAEALPRPRRRVAKTRRTISRRVRASGRPRHGPNARWAQNRQTSRSQ